MVDHSYLRLEVPGEPKGQPRAKAFHRGGITRMYDPGTADSFKRDIVHLARLNGWSGAVRSGQHCGLAVSGYFKRPKHHYTSRGALKQDSPRMVSKKPDADNFAKAVMDALTASGVWADDSQVADLSVTKYYADGEPSTVIVLALLNGAQEWIRPRTRPNNPDRTGWSLDVPVACGLVTRTGAPTYRFTPPAPLRATGLARRRSPTWGMRARLRGAPVIKAGKGGSSVEVRRNMDSDECDPATGLPGALDPAPAVGDEPIRRQPAQEQ